MAVKLTSFPNVDPNASGEVKTKRLARLEQQTNDQQPRDDCPLCQRGGGGNHIMAHRLLAAKVADVTDL